MVRFNRSMNDVFKLEHYYSPGEFEPSSLSL